MRQILGSFLTLGICLSPLNVSVVAQATTSGIGIQGGKLLAQAQNDRKAEADQLRDQGKQEFSNGQFQAAIQSWQEALKAYREIEDRMGEGNALGNLGAAYFSLNDYPRAIKYVQQRLIIAREIKDRKGESQAFNILGVIHNELRDYRRAVEYQQESLAIKREIGYRKGEGTSLYNLGEAYSNLYDYPRAIEYYEQALTLAQEFKDRSEEGDIVSNLAIVYLYINDYPRALEFSQQSLMISRELQDHNREGVALGNLGRVYLKIGDYSRAQDYFEQALPLFQETKNRESEERALNHLGIACRNLRDYLCALDYFEQALALARELKDRSEEGHILGNLGNIYLSLRSYQGAIEYQKQSLSIRRELQDRAGEGATLNNLSLPYFYQGNHQGAIEYQKQSLSIRRELQDRAGEGASLTNLGLFLLKSGKLAQAEKNLFDAIEIWESLRSELNDLNKVSIFETQIESYRLLQQVLIDLNKPNVALEVAERGRARAFVELLATQLSSEPDVTPPNIQQLKKIAQEQNATLVEYSIIVESLKNSGGVLGKESDIFVWIIQPTGEVTFRKVDLKPLWQQQEISDSKSDFWQSYFGSWGYPVTIAILTIFAGGCILILVRRRRSVPWSLLAVASIVGVVGLVGYNQLSQEIATRSGDQPETALAKIVLSTHETSQKGIRGLAEIASGKTRQRQEERLKQLHQLLIEPISSDEHTSDLQSRY
ncbi:MAG: tetratricopeptide repeat protein, partial [Symploca sp. SIO3E6]|nr:tetratricopeptide repeat protein [Caldora sp. SIO3E6]